MMHRFLANNRDELIARCRVKVAARPKRGATGGQLSNGIPMFLDQLQRTLEAEEAGESGQSLKISGGAGGTGLAVSEMGVTAAAHGKQLLALGYSVDQVVHDYGDLCQSITDLAFERDAPFEIDEFRTLNRCLDNAIADAVAEFSFQRESTLARLQHKDANERIGFLVHELRNALGTATLAFSALELGKLPIGGATGDVLKRSHGALKRLVDQALVEVRTTVATPVHHGTCSVASFIADASQAAALHATASGSSLSVPRVDPTLGIKGDRDLLLAAAENLLQNAFKFTRTATEVSLRAYAFGDRVLMEVEDRCGGLPPGNADKMFTPFSQRNEDKTGLGLGLSIARQSIEDAAGTLSVRDLPGIGCIFTINLPRHALV